MASYEYEILMTLKEIKGVLMEMKKQEFDYWEAWKLAKMTEQNTKTQKGSP